MNCVLFVGDSSALAADHVRTSAAVSSTTHEVTVFDRYLECSGQDSVLATSMMTGVYPQVHGVGPGGSGPRYAGPTLPALLQRFGVECVGIAPPAVLTSSGFGDLMCVTEGATAEELDGWLSNRGDPQRPFFVFAWGGQSGAGLEGPAGILKVLDRRCLLHDTAVIVVATSARQLSELHFVEPPVMPLRIISRGRPVNTGRGGRAVGTVDLFPTVLALTGRSESMPHVLQGTSLVLADGTDYESDGRVVFSELEDERLGLSCRIVCDEQSSYAVIAADQCGRWGRVPGLGLGLLARGPGWRRRLLFELLFRGAAERFSAGENCGNVDDIRVWGRLEIKRWAADCRARAEEIRRLAATEQDAALRTRLRGLGYLG